MQLNHYTTTFKKKTFPITLVCDNVTHALNIGSLFRTSDAFGVEEIIFCGEEIPIGKKMTKTSRATEKAVPYRKNESITTVLEELKAKDYQIVSLEITETSQPINQFKFETSKPVALVIGDENFGVSEEILNNSTHVVHIDMFGQNSSMNVVQATTIALYELTKQF